MKVGLAERRQSRGGAPPDLNDDCLVVFFTLQELRSTKPTEMVVDERTIRSQHHSEIINACDKLMVTFRLKYFPNFRCILPP